MSGLFSSDDLAGYRADGFVFRRGLFTGEEICRLGETARADHALDAAASARDDGEGNKVRLSLWNHPGEGIYGMVARCRRVVDSVEQLVGGEVYHYHSKMICCYNAAWNDPYKESHHPGYTPLHKVENSAVLEASGTAVDFADLDQADRSAKSLE